MPWRDKVLFRGSISDLEKLMRIIRERFGATVLGYKVESGRVVWGELRGIEDLPLGVEDLVGAGFYRLNPGEFFRHSHFSPKNYLHPSQQALIAETANLELSSLPEQGYARTVFFGIKPCDLKAISVLDALLLGKHPIYTARRRSVVAIVVEECTMPNKNCFCGAVASGPSASSGFDIAYTRLGAETVVFRAGSGVGIDLLNRLGLEPAGADLTSRYWEAMSRALEETRSRLHLNENYREALLKTASDERLWEVLSEKCLGCGNCNYVCPTCFCTELDYVVEGEVAVKLAKWTGCLLYSYGLVAGGHFRPKLFMRYRHFVLHKFVFYEKQVGRAGCVGCGRCITWCPVGLDLRTTILRALRGGWFEHY